MRFLSTRGASPAVGLGEAIARGLAPDGGLYLPESLPRLPDALWAGAPGLSLPGLATALLAPFAEGEIAEAELTGLLADAFDFPVPLTPLGEDCWLLELFHGPTLAFKDFGARVMARLLTRLRPAGSRPATVLVATSGDTGGAVAAAFHGLAGTRVVVLYPRGRVSERQERQFATLGGNVHALAVEGSFDDCQRLVKEALGDAALVAELALTSANSINVGRLLPQMAYYVFGWASLPAAARERPLFVVPSGNCGNLAAGLLAARLGLPAGGFLAATNRNDVVPRYLEEGVFAPRPSLPTLATAMDVGNPSNLERIRTLFGDELAALRRAVAASAHDDEEIRAAIREVDAARGVVLDPHTTVAWCAWRRYRSRGGDAPAVLLGTAHPAKFAELVEPLVGRRLPMPPQLAAALERPLLSRPLAASREDLRAVLRSLPEG